MNKFVFVTLTLIASTVWADQPIWLKTFREIYASYVQILGVDDDSLRELYRLNVDRLPKTGQASELSSSVVLATTEISGAFCKKAVDKEKALPRGERNLIGLVDVTRGPRQFTDYLRGAVIDRMGEMFWQRSATTTEKEVLSRMITAANSGGSNTPDDTINTLHVLCTSFATSLAFLTK